MDSNSDVSKEENEANRWAADFLIPQRYIARLSELKSKQAVRSFAQDIGVHPGIVVGRLQHEGFIELSWMNDLKSSFRLRSGDA